jgi:hypothetical protein
LVPGQVLASIEESVEANFAAAAFTSALAADLLSQAAPAGFAAHDLAQDEL